ncbi:MAG: hypothetical protein WCD49_05110 [Candidatus Acidiferrales bacterium]
MSALILLAVSIVLNPFGPQTQQKIAVSKVGRLCGSLVHVDDIRSKKDPTQIVDEKTKPLTRVGLQLYLRQEDSACCEGLSPIAEVATRRRGHFSFEKVDAGQYWLVARWKGHEYKLAIRYQPSKQPNGDECSHFEYRINDSGQFYGGHDVVVD